MNHDTTNARYEAQLQAKIQLTEQQLAPYYSGQIEVFASSPKHYRMRAEFKAWHEQDQVYYAMYSQGSNRNSYRVDEFPAAAPRIQILMPELLHHLNSEPQLKQKLFQVDFLSSVQGDAVITLIYHRKLDDAWRIVAERLATILDCNLIGRSRGQKIVLKNDFVMEAFEVEGKRYSYQQVESSFTQPNGKVCEKMLNWACTNTPASGSDLLELYCGNGNFTLPLATKFNRVLATEIAKSGIQSARYNCQVNQITNIEFVRLSSEELTQALNSQRQFNRLQHINLDDYQFSHIFVDPPRAGLDDETRNLTSGFDNIIYVSCNPETLIRDLKHLSNSHTVLKCALFDQFPFTEHRECGVILKKMQR